MTLSSAPSMTTVVRLMGGVLLHPAGALRAVRAVNQSGEPLSLCAVTEPCQGAVISSRPCLR